MLSRRRNIKNNTKIDVGRKHFQKQLIFIPYQFGVHQKLKIIKETFIKYKLINYDIYFK